MSKVLLFSGGGAKGAFQAGVYEQLRIMGWQPDAVGGISVGGLNGSIIATGQGKHLVDVWNRITPDQVLKERGWLRTGGSYLLHKIGIHRAPLGYFSNSPLKELLRKNIGTEFTTDFYCGTVNITTGQYVKHRAQKGMVPYPFLDPILATTAIPVVFDPVKIENDLHVDGGVRHQSPLGTVIDDQNPTEIIIVLCKKYKEAGYKDAGNPKDIVDVAKQTLDALLTEIFIKDLREFERINFLVRQAQKAGITLHRQNGIPYREFKASLYQPEESLGDSLDFSSEQARQNIQLGLEAKPITL